jgi:RNA polymerase sigma factor (sigma-70 family)
MYHLHRASAFRDEDLLLEIKAGGLRADVAMGCLYKQYRSRAYSSMKKLIAKHPLYRGSPEDLVHDSFIVLIHKIQFETFYVKSLCGFWIGVGKKLFLNQLRKDERVTLVNDHEELYGYNETTPEFLLLREEEKEQMAVAFSQLGSRCREILLLWTNRYSMSEIACRMELANDAMARKIKHACFKKLKEMVREGNKMPG